MIEIRDPTPRDVRLFGLLLPLFCGAVAALAWWKPESLIGGAVFLSAAWLVSLAFNRAAWRRQLAGATFPALFALGGNAARWGVAPVVVLLLAVVALVGPLAIWSRPALGRRLYLGWMHAAAPLGWTISHLMLGIVFFGVVLPVGWVMRLAGRDPLRRRFDRDAPSYWIERRPPAGSQRYFKQF